MLSTIGWIGSVLLSICAIPQAWSSWRAGNSRGVDGWFLFTWFLGEVLMGLYVLPTWDMPLLFNYAANIGLLSVIIKFKIWPRRGILL